MTGRDTIPRRGAAHTAAAAVVAACTLLYLVPPGTTTLYPACPVHVYLHILCPGCGATHALCCLLHLHLAEALQANPFFTILLPFAVAAGVLTYGRALSPRPFQFPQLPPPALYATLAATALFTLARNLS